MVEKVTDHKFRNGCGSDCDSCRRDRSNMCSYIGEIDGSYRHCFKTRTQHLECEYWSHQEEPSFTSV